MSGHTYERELGLLFGYALAEYWTQGDHCISARFGYVDARRRSKDLSNPGSAALRVYRASHLSEKDLVHRQVPSKLNRGS